MQRIEKAPGIFSHEWQNTVMGKEHSFPASKPILYTDTGTEREREIEPVVKRGLCQVDILP